MIPNYIKPIRYLKSLPPEQTAKACAEVFGPYVSYKGRDYSKSGFFKFLSNQPKHILNQICHETLTNS